MSSAKYRARSKLANKVKYLGADHPDTLDARRELTAVTLEEHVRRVVDTFPPLTAEQRDRIAALLRATGTGSDREATPA